MNSQKLTAEEKAARLAEYREHFKTYCGGKYADENIFGEIVIFDDGAFGRKNALHSPSCRKCGIRKTSIVCMKCGEGKDVNFTYGLRKKEGASE